MLPLLLLVAFAAPALAIRQQSTAELMQTREQLLAQLSQLETKTSAAVVPVIAVAAPFLPMSYIQGTRRTNGFNTRETLAQRRSRLTAVAKAKKSHMQATTQAPSRAPASQAQARVQVQVIGSYLHGTRCSNGYTETHIETPVVAEVKATAAKSTKITKITAAAPTIAVILGSYLHGTRCSNGWTETHTETPAVAKYQAAAATIDKKPANNARQSRAKRAERLEKLKALKTARKQARIQQTSRAAAPVTTTLAPATTTTAMALEQEQETHQSASYDSGLHYTEDHAEGGHTAPVDTAEPAGTAEAATFMQPQLPEAGSSKALVCLLFILFAVGGSAAMCYTPEQVRRNSFSESTLSSAFSSMRSAKLPALMRRRRRCSSVHFPGV